LSRIDIRLAPGIDADAVAKRLRIALPPGLAVARPETTVAASASLSRSYRVNLNVLALGRALSPGRFWCSRRRRTRGAAAHAVRGAARPRRHAADV
jgi:hypothetical protein